MNTMDTVDQVAMVMTSTQVSEYLTVPEETLQKWRCQGYGPPHAKIGRAVRYRRQDVDAWIASQVRFVA